MKLSNFLESALTDLQYYFWTGSKNSGPTRVVGSFSEVFSFSGDQNCCDFLCSFGISKVLRSVGKCGRFSCNIEIVNCLNVPLRNRNKWYSNSNDKDFWPLEIQSFHRESLFGSSDTNFEAMFSYEILSTDLAL
ncbi:unnamed protein product, partial [Allacma fusca]